jgi:predicted Fe-S protein YdhL (DUF1289 family)
MKLTRFAINSLASGACAASAGAKNDVVPSPCLSVCKMHPDNGLCMGCLRTLDEIRQWGQADAATKRGIWIQISQRLKEYSV